MNNRKDQQSELAHTGQTELPLAPHVEAWVRDIEAKVRQIVEQNRQSPSLMRRNAQLVAKLSDRLRDGLDDLKAHDGDNAQTPLLEIPVPPDSAVIVADSYFPVGWRSRIDGADRAVALAGDDQSKRSTAVEHLVNVLKYDWILPLEILNNALLVAADKLEALMHKSTVDAVTNAAALTLQGDSSDSDTPAIERKVIEKWERETPPLDTESVEWIAARKKNLFDLSLTTLRTYRTNRYGGRKTPDEMFGIDRDGRRWRRKGTRRSTVYYYAPSLKQV